MVSKQTTNLWYKNTNSYFYEVVHPKKLITLNETQFFFLKLIKFFLYFININEILLINLSLINIIEPKVKEKTTNKNDTDQFKKLSQERAAFVAPPPLSSSSSFSSRCLCSSK